MRLGSWIGWRSCSVAWAVAFASMFGGIDTASAQRRPAAELLPEKTVAYVRIPDVREMMQKMQDTSMGRMMADPEVSPLVDSLYSMATDEFEQVRDRVGLSLDELMSLPQGELCAALIETKGEEVPFAWVILLDVGSSADLADKLIGNGELAAGENGVIPDEEDVNGVTLKTINGNNPDERVIYFRRDTTYGFCNNPDVVREILARWNTAPTVRDKVFSNNRKFVTIMNRCRGTAENRPDMTFFIDPYGIFNATQEGVGGAVATAFAKSIGIDGLLGIGGSYLLDVDGFEAASHLHILTASPRSGVIKMMAMQDGDIEPQDFVPADIVTYMTVNWDVDTTYTTFEELYNTVSQSETALQDAIENNLNENLGVDFKAEILDNLAGRGTYLTWIVPPSRINSQATLLALELKDGAAAEETLAKMFETIEMPEGMKEFEYEGVTIHQFPGGGRRRNISVEVESSDDDNGGQPRAIPEPEQEEDPFESGQLRRPEPCIAIYENQLLITDAVDLMKEAIATGKGRRDRLSADPKFARNFDEIVRMLGGSRAGMIAYSKPDAILKNFYDLAQDDRNRERLRTAGEENRIAKRFDEMLTETPLPAFETLQRYIGSGGGVMTVDETGFHYFSFGLNPEE